MQNVKIGFIGAGNMATSLIGGMISDGFPAANLLASDHNQERCQWLAEQFKIQICESNQALLSQANIIVLAVKPQVMADVLRDLAPTPSDKLFISVAAGIPCQALQNWAQAKIAVVRTMPNTPALVGTGATGLFANEQVSTEQREQAETIMRAVGIALWVETEDMIDTVTALSGSGPAYFFYFMEAMEQSAVNMGMDVQTAQLLTIQTALGAAKLALESDDTPAVLRQKVTSPGGTTEAALNVLAQENVHQAITQAMQAAKTRAAELAKEFGDQ
ncbi:MAG: pyrroline-5-carboxylate reductase [Gammaproteobacteria bacterium]|nr:pyrroline-5-carboxylate reductase [Gammaproteobacteria bacterium]MDH5727857.1 pyrroline-5-carboxylate reductase [Gammaproteobacteria bacterium]